jgi:hypothetical protein
MRDSDLLATAKELRSQIRQRCNLNADWNKASLEMQNFYLMLARRIEGLEPKESTLQ